MNKRFVTLFILVVLSACGQDAQAPDTSDKDTQQSELNFDCASPVLTGTVEATGDALAAGITAYQYSVNPAERSMALTVMGSDDQILAEATLRQTFDRNGAVWLMQADGSGETFSEVGRTRFVLGTGYLIEAVRTKPGMTMRNEALIAPTLADNRVRLYGAAQDLGGNPVDPTAIWKLNPEVVEVWRDDAKTDDAALDAWAQAAGVEALYNSELANVLNAAWRDQWTNVAYEHTLTCELGVNLDDRVKVIADDGSGLSARKQALGCSNEEKIANTQKSVSKVLDGLSSITGFASSPASNFAQNASNASFGIDAGGGFVFGANGADIATIVTAATKIGVGAAAASAGAAVAPFALGLAGISAAAYIAARVNDAFGDDILRAMQDGAKGEPERKASTNSTFRSSGSNGDPHLRSLDGNTFDLQNAGEFVLVRSKDPRVALEIQARQEPFASSLCPNVAVNTAFAFRIGDHSVSVRTTAQGAELRLDGTLISAEEGLIPLSAGSFLQFEKGEYMVRWEDSSFAVVTGWSNNLDIFFVASATLSGALEGILGDSDGDPTNDYRGADGRLFVQPLTFDNRVDFAGTWRVTDESSLHFYENGEQTADFTDLAFPSDEAKVEDLPQLERDEATSTCTAAGLEGEFLQGCILDLACTGDSGMVDSNALASAQHASFRRVAPAPPELPSRPGPRSCDEIDRDAVAPVLGYEAGAVQLTGTYRVDSRVIYDADQVVTIAPGTLFIMEPDGWLIFGWRSDPAAVFMQGTAEAPILFCGATKAPGAWRGIQMAGGVIDGSQMQHVRIEDAASQDATAALEVMDNGGTAILLEHVAISGAEGLGFSFDKVNPLSNNLRVTNSGKVGKLRSFDAMTNLPVGRYRGNTDDRIEFEPGSGAGPLRMKNVGVPYHQIRSTLRTGAANGVMVIDPGVIYEVCDGCQVEFGWNGGPGHSLSAVGTAEEPIIFTSSSPSPTPGIWHGVDLLSGLSDGATLDFWQINYGGLQDSGALFVRGSPSVSNSSFSNSAGYGIFMGPGATPMLTNNTFTNNAQGDVNP